MRGEEGGSGGEGRVVKPDGRARMPDALKTLVTGSVFSDRDDVTS